MSALAHVPFATLSGRKRSADSTRQGVYAQQLIDRRKDEDQQKLHGRFGDWQKIQSKCL
jgi:hypothetical protein